MGILIGLVVGTVLGVSLTAILTVASHDDDINGRG